MDDIELLRKMGPLKHLKFLDNGDSFPYSVIEDLVCYLWITNNSGTNLLTCTVTLDDSSTPVISLSPGEGWDGEFESYIDSIAISGTNPDFRIELKRRRKI